MKEEGPGQAQGRRLRPHRREITPGKSREEGVKVQGRDPGQGLGQGQEIAAGLLPAALQDPGQGPHGEGLEAMRDPR